MNACRAKDPVCSTMNALMLTKSPSSSSRWFCPLLKTFSGATPSSSISYAALRSRFRSTSLKALGKHRDPTVDGTTPRLAVPRWNALLCSTSPGSSSIFDAHLLGEGKTLLTRIVAMLSKLAR